MWIINIIKKYFKLKNKKKKDLKSKQVKNKILQILLKIMPNNAPILENSLINLFIFEGIFRIVFFFF